MSSNLIENIRDCYRRAEHCRRKAKEQSNSVLRQDFLDCERRWLLLARGYELAARMEALARGVPTVGVPTVGVPTVGAPAVGPLKVAA